MFPYINIGRLHLSSQCIYRSKASPNPLSVSISDIRDAWKNGKIMTEEMAVPKVYTCRVYYFKNP